MIKDFLQNPATRLILPASSATRRARRLRWAIKITGTLLLLLFIWKLNLHLDQIATGILRADFLPVLFSILLIFPIMALKTWRWCLILTKLGIKLPFREAYALYALGLSAGSFTPGQSGDAIKAWYLRDRGHSFGNSLVSIVLDRLLDVIILIFLASSGLLFLGSEFAGELPILLLLGLGLSLAFLFFAIPFLRNQILGCFLAFIFRRKLKTELTENLPIAANGQTYLITLVTASLAIMRVWLLALALGMHLNLPEAITTSSLGTVAGLIPISTAGIGVRDVTLIGTLGQLGYATELAVSLSALVLLLNIVNLVVGYFTWIILSRVKQVKLAGASIN